MHCLQCSKVLLPAKWIQNQILLSDKDLQWHIMGHAPGKSLQCRTSLFYHAVQRWQRRLAEWTALVECRWTLARLTADVAASLVHHHHHLLHHHCRAASVAIDHRRLAVTERLCRVSSLTFHQPSTLYSKDRNVSHSLITRTLCARQSQNTVTWVLGQNELLHSLRFRGPCVIAYLADHQYNLVLH